MITQMFLAGVIYILRHVFKYEYEIFNHFNDSLKLVKVHKGKNVQPKKG